MWGGGGEEGEGGGGSGGGHGGWTWRMEEEEVEVEVEEEEEEEEGVLDRDSTAGRPGKGLQRSKVNDQFFSLSEMEQFIDQAAGDHGESGECDGG